MQLPLATNGGPEIIDIVVTNVDASSITTGYAVGHCIGGSASFDGTKVVKMASGTTGNLPGFLGVAMVDFGANALGRVRVFGPVASVWLSNTNTSVTVNAGDPLCPGAAAGGFFSVAPAYASSGFKYVICSNLPATPYAGCMSIATASSYCSGVINHL